MAEQPHTPLTDEQQQLARELHARGVSCRGIARELGVGAATVSRWAKDVGLSFDRTKIAAANSARAVDLRAERLKLAERLISETNLMLDILHKPHLVYSFGGRDNRYEEHTLSEPPISSQAEIIRSAALAFDKVTRIVEREGPGVEEAVGAVEKLISLVDESYDEEHPETPDAGQ